MHRIKRGFMICGILLSLLCFQTVGRSENPWSIRINIPEFKLYLYQGTEVFRTYPIAVGKPRTPSPTGEFRIVNKVVNPTWFPPNHGKPVPPGPKNPLGKYWMGLSKPGYGIHGNHSPQSIGNSASLGCFRMLNRDIEELFQTVPSGTPVQITYETVTAHCEGECLSIEVFADIYGWSNQDDALNEAIGKSDWLYEPHWQALLELLGQKKPISIEVPRSIQIEGDIPDVDGFYWNGEVYVNWKKIDGLPVEVIKADYPLEFNDYLRIDQLNVASEGKWTIEWDDGMNLLFITKTPAEEGLMTKSSVKASAQCLGL